MMCVLRGPDRKNPVAYYSNGSLGIVVGLTCGDFGTHLRPLRDIFMKLIKTLIVPLIFSTLVVGIAGHGSDLKAIGRLALKSAS